MQRRIRLTIAFDGRRWHGWQAGRSGMGVADQLQRALNDLIPGASDLVSSSRTDSGVHALALVAHVDLPPQSSNLPTSRLAIALNARLPEDIRVIKAQPAPPNFHARFDALSKQYRYQIWNAPVMNPLLLHHAWHVPQPLDLESLRLAASSFHGAHDFRAFTSRRDGQPASTMRHIHRLEVHTEGPLITIIIEADGFLYKMCRAIVGTLVRIAKGSMHPAEIKTLLSTPTTRTPGVNAPAHGLTLWKVTYPHD